MSVEITMVLAFLVFFVLVGLGFIFIKYEESNKLTKNDADYSKGKEHACRGYDRDKGQSDAYNDGYSDHLKT